MTTVNPLQALRAAQRPAPRAAALPRLLLAGATGALGNEVLNRLAGGQRYAQVQVLAREPYAAAMRGVQLQQVPPAEPAQWPALAVHMPAEVGVVMFEPPRTFHQRERALWTPEPQQLKALAQWMRGCGVKTLAVVLPHDMGSLPQAIKRGMANLDEQAVAALGFERLIFVRSARAAQRATPRHWLQRVARMMFSALSYMVPDQERPVRPLHVARLVDAALQKAPPGIHVAAPELVWRAAQRDGLGAALQAWLE